MPRAAVPRRIIRQVLRLSQAAELGNAGLSQRRIAILLVISKTTVQRILAGTHRHEVSESLLAAGEVRLAEPLRCNGCKQRIDVYPCRVCGMEAPTASIVAPLPFGQAARRNTNGRNHNRDGSPRAGPLGHRHSLSLQLTADQNVRLAQIHARRKRRAKYRYRHQTLEEALKLSGVQASSFKPAK